MPRTKTPAPRLSVPDRQDAILAALRHCPLYFILDKSLLEMHDPIKLAKSVIRAGVRMLQLRLKAEASECRVEVARELRKATLSSGCLFIVNDSVELAIECNADGVHLGADDLPVSEARSAAPDLIIGATARSPEAAWQAEVEGADYIGCGSVFGSATKPGLPVIGIEGLAAVNRYVSIPVVGIGGITPQNCGEVKATRVAGFCSIEPFRGERPAAIVRNFMRHLQPPTIGE